MRGGLERHVADAARGGPVDDGGPQAIVLAGGEVEHDVADTGVALCLFGAAARLLLADQGVHLAAVHGGHTLGRPDHQEMGVAARGGVGQGAARGGEPVDVVRQERGADLGRGAAALVVGVDDLPGAGAGQAPRRDFIDGCGGAGSWGDAGEGRGAAVESPAPGGARVAPPGGVGGIQCRPAARGRARRRRPIRVTIDHRITASLVAGSAS